MVPRKFFAAKGVSLRASRLAAISWRRIAVNGCSPILGYDMKENVAALASRGRRQRYPSRRMPVRSTSHSNERVFGVPFYQERHPGHGGVIG